MLGFNHAEMDALFCAFSQDFSVHRAIIVVSNRLGDAQLHLLVLLYSGWELVKRETVAMGTVV